MRTIEKTAPWCILLAACLWGSQGIYTKTLAAAGLTPFDIAAIRTCGAALVILSLMLALKRSLLKIKLHDLWIFLGSGLISIAGFTCLYYTAIELTSMGAAAVLMYIAPAVVTVLSRLIFKEAFTKQKLLALCCALTGCVFVSGVLTGDQRLNLVGFLCGLGSGVTYALYSIFGTFAMLRQYNPLTMVSFTFLIGTVGVLPWCSPARIAAAAEQNPALIGTAVLFVFGAALVPYLLYTLGLKYVSAAKASIMASVEAVSAALCGLAFFGEPLKVNLTIGIASIILSVICLNLHRRPRVLSPLPGSGKHQES